MLGRLLRLALAGLLVLTLAACGGPGPDPDPDPDPDPEPTWLLIPDYPSEKVQVLATDDDLDDLARTSPLQLPGTGPCGVAVGPGDRLYVADYTNEEIQVFALPGALGGGSPTPVATLSAIELGGPCGLAFDADGTLWVGDYQYEQVLAFRDVTALSGTQVLVPDVILTVAGPDVAAWYAIYDIIIDGAGRLWVVDRDMETVTRIDDVRDLDGDQTNRLPDAQIVETEATEPPAGGGYTMYYPNGIAVDANGNLYVGNEGEDYVSRFDGAAAYVGVVTPQADAYLVVAGVEYPYLVALDAEGALWVGNDLTVARVVGPEAGSGVRELTPATTVVYTTDGYSDGGGMTFVPMPPGLGF